MRFSLFKVFTFSCLAFLATSPGALLNAQSSTNPDKEVKVVVRAHTGIEETTKRWSPTMDYLSESIEGYRFTLWPVVDFARMRTIVDSGEADFILTNPAEFINLELNHNTSRIATLINGRGPEASSLFGAVIFTRKDRDDIESIEDARGRSLMGVDPEAFGGWWMALGELKRRGIDPEKDCSSVLFAEDSIQQSVVYAIRDRKADIGTVRTGILEKLAQTGEIDLEDFKILEPKSSQFPLPHSTPLYPEWPFASLKNTNNVLAGKVALALLDIKPRHPAAVAGNYRGWTIPFDYTPIRNLMMDLKVGPYKDYGQFSLSEVFQKYGWWIAGGTGLGLLSLLSAIYVNRINSRLIKAQSKLRNEISAREELIDKLQHALGEIETLRGILPICGYCKNVRNDEGYYEQIESYFRKHSDVSFSHTICPDCLETHFPAEAKAITDSAPPFYP